MPGFQPHVVYVTCNVTYVRSNPIFHLLPYTPQWCALLLAANHTIANFHCKTASADYGQFFDVIYLTINL